MAPFCTPNVSFINGVLYQIDVNGNCTPLNLRVNGAVGARGPQGIPGTPGTNSVLVQDEGAPLGAATTLNFTGAGVTVTYLAGVATIDIPGGGGGAAWLITGNAGTVDGVNFLGTTDAVALNFKVNNAPSGRIDLVRNAFFGENAGLIISNLTVGATGTDNSFYGYQSGLLNTTGSFNSAFGRNSLQSNTTGNESVAIGNNALSSSTVTNHNVAIGSDALSSVSGLGGDFNVAIGSRANSANQTSGANVSIGYESALSSTTGPNVAIGFRAFFANTTGIGNTSVGTNVLGSNVDGGNSVAIGELALFTNVSGNGSVAIGFEAMRFANDSALGSFDTFNTAVGYQALRGSLVAAANTGTNNTATGYLALFSNTSGAVNSAFGSFALTANTGGAGNSAFGVSALAANTGGGNNDAFGLNSLRTNTTGSNNAAFANSSLLGNTTGSENTAFGQSALSGNLSGSSNTAIGFSSGTTNTTGANNVFLGANAGGAAFATTSDNLFIHNLQSDNPLIYGHFVNGNIGFNTSTFGANATNTLAMINGATSPTAAIVNGIQFFSKDSTDVVPLATLGLFTEQPTEAIGLDVPTAKLRIWLNTAGVLTEHYIFLDAV